MPALEEKILAAVGHKTYTPLKLKALARKLAVPKSKYYHFKETVAGLVGQGRLEFGRNRTIRPTQPHGTVTGIYRRTSSGLGFVRPHMMDGHVGPDIRIREADSLDASTGDEVLVRVTRKPARSDLNPGGEILRVLERARRQFVGTYLEREGQGLVRVDGTVFSHSIFVGDPGAKGVRPDDKVVIEMIRFPSAEDRGEGVITEILGPHGQPGVDTLSIIREFDLPDRFPQDALEEAREAAEAFHENDLDGREDLTREVIVTIDPADARDFDDAISLSQDARSKHWQLGVHIADVSHFVPPGGHLDREARKRGTSVYLPQRALPMLPEVISNSLASLQQGRLRYVKTAFIDFSPSAQRTGVRFANVAIRVKRRFTYEQVSAILGKPEANRAKIQPEMLELLLRMRDLAMMLRKRRLRRGALELNMPEAELEFDEQGRVSGAHFVKHDISHQMIEEFMLAANEAVAEHLSGLDAPFLRRVHPAPEPTKLEAFAEFATSLGYKVGRHVDRFALQSVLAKSAAKPEAYAVHYALLRSLKQAAYSPLEDEHYALASGQYCHFTSPIRRYPDLAVHRQLDQSIRRKRVGGDEVELTALGEHCSKTERRAEAAERELVRTKLLAYLSERVGLTLEVVVTGVADYGFFAQAEKLPVEGLVHVSTLTDDYYYFDEATHSLIGRRTKRRYRLGDKIRARVVHVDLHRRLLDFRVVPKKGKGES
jgi:ribonuclease R